MATAQFPSGNPEGAGGSNREGGLLGPSPGSNPGAFQNSPGAAVLGGRPGAGASRAPTSISQPPAGVNPSGGRATIAKPPDLASNQPVNPGPVGIPNVVEYEGPEDGLTLDAAIDRLLRENLFLRAAAFEIPQADADILTASLRANPILYADSQLIPYGSYTSRRPGGQTQYDLNISYPLDITHKRRARIDSASRAKTVLEQQYRDAARLQIDNLQTAFVDVLAARATLRFAQAGAEGLTQILVPIEEKYRREAIRESDYLKVAIQREASEIALSDADANLVKSRRVLANLLNIPPEQANGLDVRGPLLDGGYEVPPEAVLVEIAMESRPDLAAFRLGLSRAEADVRLAVANRFQDVYVLYQPFTLQDNGHQPGGGAAATSWALGVTVPLPIYNRNQGNIQRAKLNVGQVQTQLAGQIREVIADVDQANRELETARSAAKRFELTLRPYAEKVLATSRQRYENGAEDLIQFLGARGEYLTISRQYLDVLVRNRRASLSLNTAVARRLLP